MAKRKGTGIRDIAMLVVDDNVLQRTIMQHLLKEQLKIITLVMAENAADGKEKLDANPDIRLVITDFNMPEKNGDEFIKEIRSSGYKHIIIGYSAVEEGLEISGEGTKELMLASGADAFMNKKYINKKRLHEEITLICQQKGIVHKTASVPPGSWVEQVEISRKFSDIAL